jgi:hypothetical protein
MSDTTLVEADIGEGESGPTILVVLPSLAGVEYLWSLFAQLAESPTGTIVRLAQEPGVSIRPAIGELTLCVVDRVPAHHLVRAPEGGFAWYCARGEWLDASSFVEALLSGPGHQYLTAGVPFDDALVEVSFGEHQL